MDVAKFVSTPHSHSETWLVPGNSCKIILVFIPPHRCGLFIVRGSVLRSQHLKWFLAMHEILCQWRVAERKKGRKPIG